MILLSFSCSFITSLSPSSNSSEPIKPLTTSGNGPAGLTAVSTSADSVKLTWQPVVGATSYHIVVSIAGSDTFPVMDVDSSTTSYEDFLAMPGSQLKYAVEAMSDSKSIGQSVIDVTTPERQPNPLTVDAKLDTKKTSSSMIGPDGGSVSLTDGKGVNYKLNIPAGALDVDTKIVLTAIKNIGGWPLDGDMLGSVKIEPEGLSLNGVATLNITFPTPQPSKNLLNLGFAFSGNGKEFHLQPAYNQRLGTGLAPVAPDGGHLSSLAKQTGESIVLETLVMYGIGVGQGTAENAGNLVRSNSPTDFNAALDQKQAAAQAIPEANVGKVLGDLEDVFSYTYALSVFLSIKGTENCSQLTKAVQNMDGFIVRSDVVLSRGSQRKELIDKERKELWDNLIDKINDVIGKNASDCVDESKDKANATIQASCLEMLLSKIANPPNPFFQDLQNKMTAKFGDASVTDQLTKLDKCLPSYSASEGLNGYVFKGNICSLRQPFELLAEGQGKFNVNFMPTTSLSGSMVAVGGGGGCTDGGAGTYIVNMDSNGSGNIILTIPADHLVCPGKKATNPYTQVFKITPLADKTTDCHAPLPK